MRRPGEPLSYWTESLAAMTNERFILGAFDPQLIGMVGLTRDGQKKQRQERNELQELLA
jgi:hypothetical protein